VRKRHEPRSPPLRHPARCCNHGYVALVAFILLLLLVLGAMVDGVGALRDRPKS